VPEKRAESDIKKIDKLIPWAMKVATMAAVGEEKAVRAQKWPDALKDKWNQVYHAEMDRLAKQANLRF
jgi:hypothetical protein